MIIKKSVKIALSLLLINSLAFGASNLETGVAEVGEKISKSMLTEGKKKIAVIEFSDLNDNVNNLGRFLAEELINELMNHRKEKGYEIVERRQLNKVLKQLKLSSSGLLDPKYMKEVGKILNVDAIVTGSLTDLGNDIKVNARIISVESAKIISTASTKIPKVGSVATLMSQNSLKVSSSSIRSSSTVTKQTVKKPNGKYFFENEDILIEYKKIQKRGYDVILYVTFFNKKNKPLQVEYYPKNSYLTDNNGLKWDMRSKQTLFTDNKITIDENRKIISQLNFGRMGGSDVSGTLFNLKAYYTVNGKDIEVKFYDIPIK